MQRIDVVKALSAMVTIEDLFSCSLGGLMDDWWNYRPGGPGVGNTFSSSGMGHPSALALGLAVALPHRRVVALDTDGSILMNTSIMCTLANESPPNLTIIIFDNGMYESIGGHPTHTSRRADLARMAEGAGCINCVTVDDVESFEKVASGLLSDNEFGFLVTKIEPGVYHWEPKQRRLTDGVEDKYRFIRHVEGLEGIVVHPGGPAPRKLE